VLRHELPMPENMKSQKYLHHRSQGKILTLGSSEGADRDFGYREKKDVLMHKLSMPKTLKS
jgi:hypothetical protein